MASYASGTLAATLTIIMIKWISCVAHICCPRVRRLSRSTPTSKICATTGDSVSGTLLNQITLLHNGKIRHINVPANMLRDVMPLKRRLYSAVDRCRSMEHLTVAAPVSEEDMSYSFDSLVMLGYLLNNISLVIVMTRTLDDFLMAFILLASIFSLGQVVLIASIHEGTHIKDISLSQARLVAAYRLLARVLLLVVLRLANQPVVPMVVYLTIVAMVYITISSLIVFMEGRHPELPAPHAGCKLGACNKMLMLLSHGQWLRWRRYHGRLKYRQLSMAPLVHLCVLGEILVLSQYLETALVSCTMVVYLVLLSVSSMLIHTRAARSAGLDGLLCAQCMALSQDTRHHAVSQIGESLLAQQVSLSQDLTTQLGNSSIDMMVYSNNATAREAVLKKHRTASVNITVPAAVALSTLCETMSESS